MTTLASIGRDARWKLKPQDYKLIKQYSKEGMPDWELAMWFEVTHQHISKILDRNKTVNYWNKLTAKRNKRKYKTDPKYRELCSLIKSRVWYKRKMYKI